MLARGRGRGSICCGSTLVLVVDVVKLHSRKDKDLEELMYLVRLIKVVCFLQVCHDHCMLSSIGKGRFEGHGEEAEWDPLRDTASGGVGIMTGHEQQRLASEALTESPVIFREMIAFLTRDGFTPRCVEGFGEVPTGGLGWSQRQV